MNEEEKIKKRRLLFQQQQEEAAKEIKKMGLTRIELHPAGGFDKQTGLVYEPIGEGYYLFKLKRYRGIAKAERIARLKCPSCGNEIIIPAAPKQKYVTCSCGRKLEIRDVKWELKTEFDNLRLEFEKKPLPLIIYKTPSKDAIRNWLTIGSPLPTGEQIKTKELYDAIKNYFKTFYDLPIKRDYDIITLSVFQSWLTEILDILFYLSISGETGSGKTALLEAIMELSRHGLVAANIKSAGIARVTEKYKLSLGIDEIDQITTKDENIEAICRQGYRRGLYYIRMAPKSHEPEFFNVFGFKAFTFRSSISDDLQNRSIDIAISRTKDKRLPILNIFKYRFSPFDLLFFWYMDNIIDFYARTPHFLNENGNTNIKDIIDYVNTVNTVNTVNAVNKNKGNVLLKNKEIDREILKYISTWGVNLINRVNSLTKVRISGRNIEIAYLIYSLTQILGLDLDDILLKVIEQKQEIEEASADEGWLGLLKETLNREYETAQEKNGLKLVPYSTLIKKYIRNMKEAYDYVPSQYQIRKLLRQVGFIDGINRKVVKIGTPPKSRLCLIYDSTVKESVGIEEINQQTEKVNVESGGEK